MNKKTSSPSGQRTWQGIGARTALAALLGMGLVAHEARGETVLFSDTFSVTANTIDVNYENDTGRQSGGSLGVIDYTKGGNNPNFSQVGHDFCPGELLLIAQGGELGYVSPGHNFIESPGTGAVSFIRFKMDPVLPLSLDQNPLGWVGVALGTSEAKRNTFINLTDGLGIAFRQNGNFAVYDGSTTLGEWPYTTDTNGFYTIEFRITGPVDGNPWDGANGTAIAVYDHGKEFPFFHYTKPGVGYTNNWITLMGGGPGGDGLACSGVDDLQIGTKEIVGTNLSLRVDFQYSTTEAVPETQAGFFDFNQNDAGSMTYPTAAGPVTVALLGLDADFGGFYTRGGVVNSGSLTYAGIYNDFAFKNGTSSPQSLTLALSGAGIRPGERYRLTFYSYDDFIYNYPSTHSVSFTGASGTTGAAGPLAYSSGADPTSDSAYAVTGYFKSDASGTLTISVVDTFTSPSLYDGVRLNAFELVPDFIPKGTLVSFY